MTFLNQLLLFLSIYAFIGLLMGKHIYNKIEKTVEKKENNEEVTKEEEEALNKILEMQRIIGDEQKTLLVFNIGMMIVGVPFLIIHFLIRLSSRD